MYYSYCAERQGDIGIVYEICSHVRYCAIITYGALLVQYSVVIRYSVQ